jgi:hypothetical protein
MPSRPLATILLAAGCCAVVAFCGCDRGGREAQPEGSTVAGSGREILAADQRQVSRHYQQTVGEQVLQYRQAWGLPAPEPLEPPPSAGSGSPPAPGPSGGDAAAELQPLLDSMAEQKASDDPFWLVEFLAEGEREKALAVRDAWQQANEAYQAAETAMSQKLNLRMPDSVPAAEEFARDAYRGALPGGALPEIAAQGEVASVEGGLELRVGEETYLFRPVEGELKLHYSEEQLASLEASRQYLAAAQKWLEDYRARIEADKITPANAAEVFAETFEQSVAAPLREQNAPAE